MTTKKKFIIVLVLLCIVDVVIPVPIVGVILIYVVLNRPPWVVDMIEDIWTDL